MSSWSLDAQTINPHNARKEEGTQRQPPSKHTACSITELMVLSIVLTRGTRGKNSKFKGKYHRNENVNGTRPINRHAEMDAGRNNMVS